MQDVRGNTLHVSRDIKDIKRYKSNFKTWKLNVHSEKYMDGDKDRWDTAEKMISKLQDNNGNYQKWNTERK